MVRQKMMDTHKLRMSWIHGTDAPSVTDIFGAYPRFTDHDGYLWVNQFEVLIIYIQNHNKKCFISCKNCLADFYCVILNTEYFLNVAD